MAQVPLILAFAASIRRGSLNGKLLAVVVREAREAGGEVTLVDLNDFALPLYNGNLEETEGPPANAVKMVELIRRHHALLIASPEYNSLITPLLKNTIDWCTRVEPDPFPGKVAAVVSASPGVFGGVRSALVARQLLLHLGCHVVPAQCTLPRANEAFDKDGMLKDPRAQKAAQRVAAELIRTATRLMA